MSMFDHVYAEETDELAQRARGLRGLPRDASRGPAHGETTNQKVTLAKALNMGLRRAMEDDPKVLLMGEDVGKLGGVFRITDGLQKDFGEDRVIDTPLAESGIVGTAVGMAMRGYRPVVEIQFDGFVYPAYDQIVCQVAKMCYRSQGKTPAARWSSGSRSAAASARSSTTASRPRRSSPTRRASRSSRAPTRSTATG